MQNNMQWHSEQWKDRGWSKMKEVLDSEMPRKKKRRGFFWLWFGLVGIGLAAASVWWFTKKQSSNEPVAINESIRSTTNEQYISLNNEEINQERVLKDDHALDNQAIDPLEDAAEKAIEVEVQQEVNRSNFDNSINKAEKGSELTSTAIKNVVQSKSIVVEPKQRDEEPKEIKTKQTTEIPAKLALVDDKLGIRQSRNLVLESLPMRFVELLTFDRLVPFNVYPAKFQREVDVQSNFQASIKPMVFIGGFLGINNYEHGFHLGAGLEYNFAKQWIVNLGAAWGRHRFSNMGFFAETQQDAQFEPVGVEDINNEFTVLGYDPSDQTEKTLSFLDAPFQFNYMVNSNWYLFGGYQYSYLLNIEDPNTRQSADMATSGQEQRTLVADPYSLDLLEKHYHAVLGGVGFRTGHFSFQVGYNYGLTNMLSSNVEPNSSIFRRAGSVKVFYRF